MRQIKFQRIMITVTTHKLTSVYMSVDLQLHNERELMGKSEVIYK